MPSSGLHTRSCNTVADYRAEYNDGVSCSRHATNCTTLNPTTPKRHKKTPMPCDPTALHTARRCTRGPASLGMATPARLHLGRQDPHRTVCPGPHLLTATVPQGLPLLPRAQACALTGQGGRGVSWGPSPRVQQSGPPKPQSAHTHRIA